MNRDDIIALYVRLKSEAWFTVILYAVAMSFVIAFRHTNIGERVSYRGVYFGVVTGWHIVRGNAPIRRKIGQGLCTLGVAAIFLATIFGMLSTANSAIDRFKEFGAVNNRIASDFAIIASGDTLRGARAFLDLDSLSYVRTTLSYNIMRTCDEMSVGLDTSAEDRKALWAYSTIKARAVIQHREDSLIHVLRNVYAKISSGDIPASQSDSILSRAINSLMTTHSALLN